MAPVVNGNQIKPYPSSFLSIVDRTPKPSDVSPTLGQLNISEEKKVKLIFQNCILTLAPFLLAETMPTQTHYLEGLKRSEKTFISFLRAKENFNISLEGSFSESTIVAMFKTMSSARTKMIEEMTEMRARVNQESINDPQASFRRKVYEAEQTRMRQMIRTDLTKPSIREAARKLLTDLCNIQWFTTKDHVLYGLNGIAF